MTVPQSHNESYLEDGRLEGVTFSPPVSFHHYLSAKNFFRKGFVQQSSLTSIDEFRGNAIASRCYLTARCNIPPILPCSKAINRRIGLPMWVDTS